MKKFFTLVALATIYSATVFAQDSNNSNKDLMPKEKIQKASPEQKERMEDRKKRTEKMSSEKKQNIAERKEKFKALPPEKQEAAKSEMKRHREEMKKITGEDFGGHHDEHNHENHHNKKDSAAK